MKKVSVAVPTITGRGKYLEACLRTCVGQDVDFEILVSDNPGAEARDIASAFGDPRIRYITPPQYLPMSMHWDFVLGQATGDLIAFIGDDDGLMPGAIKRVLDIASQYPEIPIHHALANYHWPDFLKQKLRNSIVFFHPTGWGQRIVQSAEFLRLAAQGKARYVDGPMVYHNFVPRSLLCRLTKDGKFFRRAAPDVYSSIAIAANTREFFSTNELLTLSGQGAQANGAAVESGKGEKFLSEMLKHYAPRFGGAAIQISLLDCLLEVAEHFDQPELMAQIDIRAHFILAYLEALRMPKQIRAREKAFAINGYNGVFAGPRLAIHRFIAERLGGLAPKPRQPSNIAFQTGQFLQMPSSTKDIFDAARELQVFLTHFLRDAAQRRAQSRSGN